MNDLQKDEPTAHEPADAPQADTHDDDRSMAQRLGPVAVLGAIALFFPAAGGFLLLIYLNSIGTWLNSLETLGYFVYVGGFILFAGLALLPTYAQAVLAGWAFGFPVGLALALCGFAGAATLGYCIARPAAGDRVTGIINEKPRWKAVHDALVGAGRLKTFAIVTLVRLPPNSPFALTNLVLASVKVPLPIYVAGTAIGMLPRTAAVIYLASMIEGELTREAVDGTRNTNAIIAGVLVTLFVVLVIGSIANRAIRRVTSGSNAPVQGNDEIGSV